MRLFLRSLGLLLLVAGAILGEPESSTAETPAIKGDGGIVRVLDNPSGTQAWPRYAIQKYKLDQKYGFKLEVVPYNTTQAGITAFQAGAADIGQFNWTDIVRLRNAGIKIVGVAPTLKWADHVLVPTSSPAKTLADLKGKKLGVTARTNLNWIVMRAATLKSYGWDLEAPQEGAVTLLRGLFEQGQLDAVVMFNTLTPTVIADGRFRVLYQIKDLIAELGIPDIPFLMYAANTTFAAEHSQNVKAFLAAYREGVEIIRTDDAIWPEYAKVLTMPNDATLISLRDEIRTDIMSAFDATSEAGIRKTFDILLATGGPEPLGMDRLPEGFMTLGYQQ